MARMLRSCVPSSAYTGTCCRLRRRCSRESPSVDTGTIAAKRSGIAAAKPIEKFEPREMPVDTTRSWSMLKRRCTADKSALACSGVSTSYGSRSSVRCPIEITWVIAGETMIQPASAAGCSQTESMRCAPRIAPSTLLEGPPCMARSIGHARAGS